MAAVSIKGVLIADSACLEQVVGHIALAYTRQANQITWSTRSMQESLKVYLVHIHYCFQPLIPGSWLVQGLYLHRTCQAGIIQRNRVPAITPVDINLLILNKVLYPVQVSHPRSMVDVCFGTCSAHPQPFRHVRDLPLRTSETL